MAANTGQVGPDDVWLGKLKEEILEPDLPIVDPHHHLWLRNGYSYLMPDLAVDLSSGHNVVATVFANATPCTEGTDRNKSALSARRNSCGARRP